MAWHGMAVPGCGKHNARDGVCHTNGIVSHLELSSQRVRLPDDMPSQLRKEKAHAVGLRPSTRQALPRGSEAGYSRSLKPFAFDG